MNAFELRLGNYVTIDNPKSHPQVKGVPMQVYQFKSGNNMFYPKSGGSIGLVFGDETFSQMDEFIKPIPITEKWLKDFGFKRQNNAWNGPHKDDFSLWNPIGETDFTLNDTVLCPKVDYVHQLQNLYYTLTGKDLKVI